MVESAEWCAAAAVRVRVAFGSCAELGSVAVSGVVQGSSLGLEIDVSTSWIVLECVRHVGRLEGALEYVL